MAGRVGECVHQLDVYRLANGRTVLTCEDCAGILREFPSQQDRLIRWSDPVVARHGVRGEPGTDPLGRMKHRATSRSEAA